MLSDPQTLAFTSSIFVSEAGNISLPATGRGLDKSEYTAHPVEATVARELVLTTSSIAGKRQRCTVRLDVTGYDSNPQVSGTSVPTSAAVYLVMDKPLPGAPGISDADMVDMVTALVTWLSASSYAKVTSLLLGET